MKFSLPYCKRCELETSHAGIDAILVENLEVGYGRQDPVLTDINFKVSPGSRIALLGPNGSGKSTLLQTLVGILKPKKGSIKIFNHDLDACLHEVTYLPQRSNVDWGFPMTLHQLIQTGCYIHVGWFKRPNKSNFDAVDRAINTLGLKDVSSRQIGELSVGQQQRALLARALVHNAEVFILDEPYSAVDKETQDIMREQFLQLKESGKTLFIATHHREHLHEDYEGALHLENGKLLKQEIF
jgi:manganese/zinc/iron transport system ATP- binding protein